VHASRHAYLLHSSLLFASTLPAAPTFGSPPHICTRFSTSAGDVLGDALRDHFASPPRWRSSAGSSPPVSSPACSCFRASCSTRITCKPSRAPFTSRLASRSVHAVSRAAPRGAGAGGRLPAASQELVARGCCSRHLSGGGGARVLLGRGGRSPARRRGPRSFRATFVTPRSPPAPAPRRRRTPPRPDAPAPAPAPALPWRE